MQYTRKNKKSWLLPLIAGASIVIPFTQISQAQSQSTPVDESDSETYLVQGKKGANNTCHFSTSLTLYPGEKAVEARQVGFDAPTCTIKMQRLTNKFTPDAAENARTGIGTKSGTLAAPPASASLVNPAAAVLRSRAYSRTYLVNLNNVFQNHVKDGVDFLYDGFNVSGSCQTFADQGKWNTAFWAFLSRTNTTCLYNPSQTTITGSTGMRFASPAGAYCGVRTDVYYNRHKTIGKANGAIVDQTNFGGSSGCLGALFIKNQIVRY